MDGVAQARGAAHAEEVCRRGVWTEPAADVLPAPSFEPIQRTFDLLVPDHSALLAYVIENVARAYTSVIAVKDDGDITRRHAPRDRRSGRGLAHAIGPPGTSRCSPRRGASEAVDRPVPERATLHKILTGPDQLAREINAKRVVIDPAPAWLLGLLGGAAVAAMAGRAEAIANIRRRRRAIAPRRSLNEPARR